MADTKFLDYNGLQYFYSKLLTKFPEGTDFSNDFTVIRDENQQITSISLNLGDGLTETPVDPSDPTGAQEITIDTGDLFVDMFREYVAGDVPTGKTDADNIGKQILRVNPDYLQFEYVDSNTTSLRLNVKADGIGAALAEESGDGTTPPTEGNIYYNTTTHELSYILPAASANTRGGITVGDGLEITTSTTDKLKAKVDGTTIEIDSQTKALKVKDNAFCPLENAGTAQDPEYKVPTQYLPSYVDDVIEGYYRDADPTAVPPVTEGFFENRTGSGTEQDPYVYIDPITGESSKIYVDLSSGRTFRWSGSVWVEISSGSFDLITDNDIDTIMGANVIEP